MTTVGLILVGNELLTGKIRDENGYHLAKFCFNHGAVLSFIIVVPDLPDRIATAVNQARTEVDIVITSGGVGPTHDDITYESIAQAFGVKTAPAQELVSKIKSYFGSRTTDAHLKMGHIPSNATLTFPKAGHWPTVSVDNVFIFPGVPHIFNAKLESIAGLFKGTRSHLVNLRIKGDEGTIADLLAETEQKFDIAIGSYPIFDEPNFNVLVTVEGPIQKVVERAKNQLIDQLAHIVEMVSEQE